MRPRPSEGAAGVEGDCAVRAAHSWGPAHSWGSAHSGPARRAWRLASMAAGEHRHLAEPACEGGRLGGHRTPPPAEWPSAADRRMHARTRDRIMPSIDGRCRPRARESENERSARAHTAARTVLRHTRAQPAQQVYSSSKDLLGQRAQSAAKGGGAVRAMEVLVVVRVVVSCVHSACSCCTVGVAAHRPDPPARWLTGYSCRGTVRGLSLLNETVLFHYHSLGTVGRGGKVLEWWKAPPPLPAHDGNERRRSGRGGALSRRQRRVRTRGGRARSRSAHHRLKVPPLLRPPRPRS